MPANYEIVSIDAANLERRGFFCYMSKRKTPGYRQKQDWLRARLAEGLRLKILHENGGRDVGFIEYIPGEYAWRAVHAPGYLVIHCLWVVGKGKGKGYGSLLLQECLQDARQQGKHGVVMVSSQGNWLAGKDLFLKNGFVETGSAPPSFHLLVHRFADRPEPAFPSDWQARQARYSRGLTVIRTPQCPYIDNAAQALAEYAHSRGMTFQMVEYRNAQEVQSLSPSPYGVFGVLYEGQLLSYSYLMPRDLEQLLGKA